MTTAEILRLHEMGCTAEQIDAIGEVLKATAADPAPTADPTPAADPAPTADPAPAADPAPTADPAPKSFEDEFRAFMKSSTDQIAALNRRMNGHSAAAAEILDPNASITKNNAQIVDAAFEDMYN